MRPRILVLPALLLAALALQAAAQSPAPAPATIAFTVSPQEPRPGEAVVFTDSSSASFGNATRNWRFGDGGTATGLTVSHAFAAEGDHEVRLSIGKSSHTEVVRVARPAPAAAFEVDPAAPVAGYAVVFIDRSFDEDDAIVNWTWDFGDGSRAFGELRPRHTFDAPGTFSVTLAVVDEAGHRSIATQEVEVRMLEAGEAPPDPPLSVDPYASPGPPAALLVAAILGLALLGRRRSR